MLLAVANTIVAIAVARSDSYDSRQKTYQYFPIWFVPIIGSALLWYILHEESIADIKSGEGRNAYTPDDYPEHHDGQ